MFNEAYIVSTYNKVNIGRLQLYIQELHKWEGMEGAGEGGGTLKYLVKIF